MSETRCPFCGDTRTPVMHRETDPGVADWRCHLMAARCANGECRATGPFVREYEYMGEGSAFEAALAAWNRRVDPIARLEAWRGEGEGRRYEVVSPVSPIGPDRLTPNGGWCVNLLTGGSTIRGRFTRSRWGDTLSEAVEVATKEVEG